MKTRVSHLLGAVLGAVALCSAFVLGATQARADETAPEPLAYGFELDGGNPSDIEEDKSTVYFHAPGTSGAQRVNLFFRMQPDWINFSGSNPAPAYYPTEDNIYGEDKVDFLVMAKVPNGVTMTFDGNTYGPSDDDIILMSTKCSNLGEDTQSFNIPLTFTFDAYAPGDNIVVPMTFSALTYARPADDVTQLLEYGGEEPFALILSAADDYAMNVESDVNAKSNVVVETNVSLPNDAATAVVGQTVWCTSTITNESSANATDLEFTAKLPDGLNFVEGSIKAANSSGDDISDYIAQTSGRSPENVLGETDAEAFDGVSMNIGDLLPGKSITIGYEAVVGPEAISESGAIEVPGRVVTPYETLSEASATLPVSEGEAPAVSVLTKTVPVVAEAGAPVDVIYKVTNTGDSDVSALDIVGGVDGSLSLSSDDIDVVQGDATATTLDDATVIADDAVLSPGEVAEVNVGATAVMDDASQEDETFAVTVSSDDVPDIVASAPVRVIEAVPEDVEVSPVANGFASAWLSAPAPVADAARFPVVWIIVLAALVVTTIVVVFVIRNRRSGISLVDAIADKVDDIRHLFGLFAIVFVTVAVTLGAAVPAMAADSPSGPPPGIDPDMEIDCDLCSGTGDMTSYRIYYQCPDGCGFQGILPINAAMYNNLKSRNAATYEGIPCFCTDNEQYAHCKCTNDFVQLYGQKWEGVKAQCEKCGGTGRTKAINVSTQVVLDCSTKGHIPTIENYAHNDVNVKLTFYSGGNCPHMYFETTFISGNEHDPDNSKNFWGGHGDFMERLTKTITVPAAHTEFVNGDYRDVAGVVTWPWKMIITKAECGHHPGYSGIEDKYGNFQVKDDAGNVIGHYHVIQCGFEAELVDLSASAQKANTRIDMTTKEHNLFEGKAAISQDIKSYTISESDMAKEGNAPIDKKEWEARYVNVNLKIQDDNQPGSVDVAANINAPSKTVWSVTTNDNSLQSYPSVSAEKPVSLGSLTLNKARTTFRVSANCAMLDDDHYAVDKPYVDVVVDARAINGVWTAIGASGPGVSFNKNNGTISVNFSISVKSYEDNYDGNFWEGLVSLKAPDAKSYDFALTSSTGEFPSGGEAGFSIQGSEYKGSKVTPGSNQTLNFSLGKVNFGATSDARDFTVSVAPTDGSGQAASQSAHVTVEVQTPSGFNYRRYFLARPTSTQFAFYVDANGNVVSDVPDEAETVPVQWKPLLKFWTPYNDDTLSYEISAANGAPLGDGNSISAASGSYATVDGDGYAGSVELPTITFTEEGHYTYTFKQTTSGAHADDVNYVDDVETVNVTVTKQADGRLYAQPDQIPVIKNEYKWEPSKAKFALGVEHSLAGEFASEHQNGQYEFQVQAVEAGQNGADASTASLLPSPANITLTDVGTSSTGSFAEVSGYEPNLNYVYQLNQAASTDPMVKVDSQPHFVGVKWNWTNVYSRPDYSEAGRSVTFDGEANGTIKFDNEAREYAISPYLNLNYQGVSGMTMSTDEYKSFTFDIEGLSASDARAYIDSLNIDENKNKDMASIKNGTTKDAISLGATSYTALDDYRSSDGIIRGGVQFGRGDLAGASQGDVYVYKVQQKAMADQPMIILDARITSPAASYFIAVVEPDHVVNYRWVDNNGMPGSANYDMSVTNQRIPVYRPDGNGGLEELFASMAKLMDRTGDGLDAYDTAATPAAASEVTPVSAVSSAPIMTVANDSPAPSAVVNVISKFDGAFEFTINGLSALETESSSSIEAGLAVDAPQTTAEEENGGIAFNNAEGLVNFGEASFDQPGVASYIVDENEDHRVEIPNNEPDENGKHKSIYYDQDQHDLLVTLTVGKDAEYKPALVPLVMWDGDEITDTNAYEKVMMNYIVTAWDYDHDGTDESFDIDGDGNADAWDHSEEVSGGYGYADKTEDNTTYVSPASAEYATDPTDGGRDTNGDGRKDVWDTDGDGKIDAWDTDGDGLPDAWDVDRDGNADAWDHDEPRNGVPEGPDDYERNTDDPDRVKPDNFPEVYPETHYGCDPEDNWGRDSNGDGRKDEWDYDGDGKPDAWGKDPSDPDDPDNPSSSEDKSKEDGKPHAWDLWGPGGPTDRERDGKPDAWDRDGDGNADTWDYPVYNNVGDTAENNTIDPDRPKPDNFPEVYPLTHYGCDPENDWGRDTNGDGWWDEFDRDGDGFPESWDKTGPDGKPDGKPDTWDTGGGNEGDAPGQPGGKPDGKPDAWDTDFDGNADSWDKNGNGILDDDENNTQGIDPSSPYYGRDPEDLGTDTDGDGVKDDWLSGELPEAGSFGLWMPLLIGFGAMVVAVGGFAFARRRARV